MAVHGRDFSEIGDDEPVFAIRAKDRVAPGALVEYARLAERAGASEELVVSVLAHAQRMRDWQMANGSKVPDLK